MILKKHISVILLGIGLAGCSSYEVILPGERIGISSGAANLNLEIDQDAAAEGVGLPAAFANNRFEGPGSNAAHSGGHFVVNFPLKSLFREDVGVGADEGTEMAQPVANNKAVFTVTPGGVVMASNIDNGDVIWEIDIDPSEDDTQLSTSGGIALGENANGDVVFVHSAKTEIFALNAENGQMIWSVDLGVLLGGGPTVNDSTLLIADTEGRVYALSTLDGEELWNRIGTLEDTSITGTSFPAINGGDVLLTGSDGEFLNVTLEQGSFNWGENLTPLELRTALDGISDIKAHPVHDGGFVYVITHGGFMYAFNAQTGRIIWEQTIQGIQMPWLSGKSIFVTTIDGRIVALRRNDGAIRWVTELPGAFDPNLPVVEDGVSYTSAVVVSGKVLVASSEGKLFILDAATGRIEDDLSTRGAVYAAPIVANNTIYVLNQSGDLIAWR